MLAVNLHIAVAAMSHIAYVAILALHAMRAVCDDAVHIGEKASIDEALLCAHNPDVPTSCVGFALVSAKRQQYYLMLCFSGCISTAQPSFNVRLYLGKRLCTAGPP
jgi:hypothetical protein